MKQLAVVFFVSVLMGSYPIMAADQSGAMDFKFEEDDYRWMDMGLRQTIYADGVITSGTAARLNDFLNMHHAIPGAMIDFNSPGGNLQEGLQIGRLIRQRNLQTNISQQGAEYKPDQLNGFCYSACSIAFLGGIVRYAPANTAFGVHRFAIPQNTLTGDQALDASQIQSSQIAEYLNFMGIQPGFISEINLASPNEINILSQQKLTALRVITPQRETAWELRTTPTGEVYVAGETRDIRGTHKILFGCFPRSQTVPFMEIMFNANDGQKIVDTTAVMKLRVNESDVPILKSEIIKGPHVENSYVSTHILLTSRIFGLIQKTVTLGISMYHLSGFTYAGFDADFTEGKPKVMAYLRPCIAAKR